jgi:hypothetical protein
MAGHLLFVPCFTELQLLVMLTHKVTTPTRRKMNRRIRDLYVQWCERRTSSLTSGEALSR